MTGGLSGTTELDGQAVQGAEVVVVDTGGSTDPSQWTVAGGDTTGADGSWHVSGLEMDSERYHAFVQFEDGGQFYNAEGLPYLTPFPELLPNAAQLQAEALAPEIGLGIPNSGSNQWRVDEGSGTTLNDSVGSVSATINGATWQSDSSAVGGYHLSHDGQDDEWHTDAGVLTTPFSVGGWVRFDDMTSFDNPIVSVDNSGDRVSSNGDGALATALGGSSRIGGQSFPTTGNWGFFAWNVESSQHRLITWSNSAELADNTNGNGVSQTDDPLYVGTRGSGAVWLTGDTDFFVVSEGSLLTKSEWTELWEATQR